MSTHRRTPGTCTARVTRSRSASKEFWDKLGKVAGDAAAIDPSDKAGRKNAYIALVRDLATHSGLTGVPNDGVLLDFGCGTGTFLSRFGLERPQIFAIGADISPVMLRNAIQRSPELLGRLFQYDGQRLPMADECLNAITTGGVLLYFREDHEFRDICDEFYRVLSPGGIVVAVEQVRAVALEDRENLKLQRSAKEIVELFEAAGFICEGWRQIRRGRFPLIYAIRYGLIPKKVYRLIAKLESFLWDRLGLPRYDYADATFLFRKRSIS
ncbi:MAG: class I SAM-dependent methyltransferase [Dokdonella sp.]|uniref:class I SAM-dependent methyltransferase n=1 Tax=Dokdonella sp. TaxID=2291710 RepID=UPI0025BF4FC1|nr:class I SAM-dependent methyltransferase [Dokdonella sp.]MBK8122819.1 class I SAM-dependent methyltransferase [Dokdonella sp.]